MRCVRTILSSPLFPSSLLSSAFQFFDRLPSLNMVRRIPDERRWQIIGMSRAGMAQKAIAEKIPCSVATVNRIISAFRREGRVKDAPRGRPPAATTSEEDETIRLRCQEDPFGTATDIKRETGVAASVRTIQRRLRKSGLKSGVAVQKPLFSRTHSDLRLSYATEHLHWETNEWANVVFSDEATFSTQWNQTRRVWRPPRSR